MLVLQMCQILRHEAGCWISARFSVAKHRCETHSFCNMICSRDPGMILFVGIGKKALSRSQWTNRFTIPARTMMEPMKPMKPMKPMEPMKPATPWWPDDLGQPDTSGPRTTSVTPTSQAATDWPSRGAERRRSTTRASTRSEACSNNRGRGRRPDLLQPERRGPALASQARELVNVPTPGGMTDGR